MWRCPVCEKEHMQGLVCDDCGYDLSCDYEQNRTLCSALPKRVEPISVRAAKWREQQREPEQVPAPRQKSISWKNTGMCAIMALMVTVCMMQQSDQSRTAKQYGNGSPTATPEPTDVVTRGEAGPSITRSDPGVVSFTLTEGLTTIDDYAFNGYTSLTEITLPESVTEIGYGAFGGCASLTDVYYSGTEEQWQSIKFGDDNESLLNATIHFMIARGEAGPSVTWTLSDTGMLTISGRGKMYDVDFEDSLWDSCQEQITRVIVESGVTNIGERAFQGCTNLTSITLPEGVTQIGGETFSDCSSLTSITLPESVTQIDKYAFSGCTNLTSITLPEGVTTIGGWTFNDCTSLTSIVLPEGVTKIGDFAFHNCSSLTSITLPEGVSEIGTGAFYDCSSLTSITLPEGVSEIGTHEFHGCSSLTSITLPEGVTEIGDYAFLHCARLTDVYYNGTEEQWQSIKFGDGNGHMLNSIIHF